MYVWGKQHLSHLWHCMKLVNRSFILKYWKTQQQFCALLSKRSVNNNSIWRLQAIPQKTVSFFTDNSLEYLDLSHLSITSNGLSIEETENLLGVLPYQFEPVFDRRSQLGGGVVNTVTYEVHSRHTSTSYLNIYLKNYIH